MSEEASKHMRTLRCTQKSQSCSELGSCDSQLPASSLLLLTATNTPSSGHVSTHTHTHTHTHAHTHIHTKGHAINVYVNPNEVTAMCTHMNALL